MKRLPCYEVAPKFRFKKHRTARALVLSFLNMDPEVKVTDPADMLQIDPVTGEPGESCQAMVETFKKEGFWGYSNAKTETIHYWTDGRRSFRTLLAFFGHEMGHLVEAIRVRDNLQVDNAKTRFKTEAEANLAAEQGEDIADLYMGVALAATDAAKKVRKGSRP